MSKPMTKFSATTWKVLSGLLVLAALGLTAGIYRQSEVPVVQTPKSEMKQEGAAQVVSLLERAPFLPGEIIRYDIRKLKLKAGEASLEYRGLVDVDGISAVEIIFTASALNFLDEEKIYLDPQTFYPLVVKRNLNLWGKKETISELYDHSAGKIRIVKDAGGKTTEQILKREGPIDNIYAFIYRYRMSGTYQQGEVLNLHLPTKDVVIKLMEKVHVDASGKKQEAFFMQSDPKQYQLWIGATEQKLPLRIDGAVGLGKTLMVMREYEPGQAR